MSPGSLSQSAAIVCREVANAARILYAKRSERLEASDSGWQFLCGADKQDISSAQVWAIHEVLERDSSLAKFIDYPVGTVLRRSSSDVEWEVSLED